MKPILRSRSTAAAATTALAACLYVLAACATSDHGTLAEERITHGDTLIVRTNGGSVWDTTATLTEELRIGKLEGAEYEMFGRVTQIAPDRHGGVYIFDGKAPALRHFDSTGHYVGTLGREGSGPGEYRDAALALHVMPDGRVLMRDPRNSRINVYSASGEPLDQWRFGSGLFAGHAMVVDTAGQLYLKILAGSIKPNEPWPIAEMRMSPTGEIIDTIVAPPIPDQPMGPTGRFGASKTWEISPLGDIVVGVTAPYSFMLLKPDGRVVRIEKSYTPVEMGAEEHAEREAVNDWTRKYQGQFYIDEIPPVPTTMPAYHGFDIGDDGQIWVHVYVPTVKVTAEPVKRQGIDVPQPAITWREPAVYDVFEPDGTYLGRVRMPEGVALAAHSGSEVWGRGAGEMGDLYVVRYRLDSDPR